MSKLCSVCGTENRDEAQFCRACGTAFAAAIASAPGEAANSAAASNVCSECGFQNKPGIRYCANCGMSLAAAAAGDGSPPTGAGEGPYAGLSPPPISYPSYATVPPYPPAPTDTTDYAPLLGDHAAADIPDPDASIALRQQEAAEGHGDASTAPFQPATEPRRATLVVGGVIAALVVAGVAAWFFMGRSNPATPQPGVTAAPVLAAPDAASAAASTPIIIEADPASAAAPASAVAAGASAAEAGVPPAAAPALGPLGPPPTAAAPLPQLSDTPSGETPAAEAKRIAAEKRRDKAARDKAERDAKASAANDQRNQSSAASQRSSDQEAQARRRADEAQRARPSAAVPASPAPVTAQARGVQEACAGRGAIAEAVCQSRQCAAPEHANEPLCRRLREADERRRNL